MTDAGSASVSTRLNWNNPSCQDLSPRWDVLYGSSAGVGVQGLHRVWGGPGKVTVLARCEEGRCDTPAIELIDRMISDPSPLYHRLTWRDLEGTECDSKQMNWRILAFSVYAAQLFENASTTLQTCEGHLCDSYNYVLVRWSLLCNNVWWGASKSDSLLITCLWHVTSNTGPFTPGTCHVIHSLNCVIHIMVMWHAGLDVCVCVWMWWKGRG